MSLSRLTIPSTVRAHGGSDMYPGLTLATSQHPLSRIPDIPGLPAPYRNTRPTHCRLDCRSVRQTEEVREVVSSRVPMYRFLEEVHTVQTNNSHVRKPGCANVRVCVN